MQDWPHADDIGNLQFCPSATFLLMFNFRRYLRIIAHVLDLKIPRTSSMERRIDLDCVSVFIESFLTMIATLSTRRYETISV